MTTPIVSVLIPTWNRARLVQDAVASALGQTLEDLEVVVVVDGSTDGTADVLRARFDDPRLRILEQTNTGLSGARNAGIDAARGTYIALLDDDDRCLPERLAQQVRALDEHPEAALCLADAAYEGGAGAVTGTLHGQPDYRPPDSLRAMFEGAWTLPSVMLFRASVLRALRFDPSIRCQEDTDLLFRFHRGGHGVVSVDTPLVRYATVAVEGGGRISERRAEMDEAYARIYVRHWDEVDAAARARIRPPAHVSRRLARFHADRGEWERAAQWWFACWRARPWRVRPLLRGLRCRAAARGATTSPRS